MTNNVTIVNNGTINIEKSKNEKTQKVKSVEIKKGDQLNLESETCKKQKKLKSNQEFSSNNFMFNESFFESPNE